MKMIYLGLKHGGRSRSSIIKLRADSKRIVTRFATISHGNHADSHASLIEKRARFHDAPLRRLSVKGRYPLILFACNVRYPSAARNRSLQRMFMLINAPRRASPSRKKSPLSGRDAARVCTRAILNRPSASLRERGRGECSVRGRGRRRNLSIRRIHRRKRDKIKKGTSVRAYVA